MNKFQEPRIEYDLENRLITYAIITSDIAEELPRTKLGNHLSGQLIRSGTSPALNYGEVQGAESRKDFIHKLSIILKELRETKVNLLIIKMKPLLENENVEKALDETLQLIAIFSSSIKTASSKLK
jgi:four helix bundle protein